MKSVYLKLACFIVLLNLGFESAFAYSVSHGSDGDRNPTVDLDSDLSFDSLCSPSITENTSGGVVYFTVAGTPDPSKCRIIDITASPFSADTTGTTDSTLAFQKAISFVISQQYKTYTSGMTTSIYHNVGDRKDDQPSYIIYVPNGTYQVSDSITYRTGWGGNHLGLSPSLSLPGSNDDDILYVDLATGNTMPGDSNYVEVLAGTSQPANSAEALAQVRILGQSRDGVTILLYNDETDFSSAKPILSIGHPDADANSSVSYNALRNLTIRTGCGNPGAIGIQFSGANFAAVDNISILTGDDQENTCDEENEAEGTYGFYIKHQSTQGYYRDMTIDGFEKGIYTTPNNAAQATFEHVTINNSKEVAIETEDMGLSLRKILIDNYQSNSSCGSAIIPAIKNSGSGQIVLIDSTLISDTTDTCFSTLNDAIYVTSGGHTHTRGLKIDNNSSSYDADFSNFSSGSLQSSLSSASATLAIVPADPSTYDYSGLTVVVIDSVSAMNTFFSSGNNSAVDYALLLTARDYAFTSTYEVTANIKVISSLYGSIKSSTNLFVFDLHQSNNTSDPLIIEDMMRSDGATKIVRQKYQSTRPVVLRNLAGTNPYQNIDFDTNTSKTPKQLYAESVGGLGKSIPLRELKLWARGINTEQVSDPYNPTNANFPINESSSVIGSEAWIFGYKVEKNMPSFSVNHPDDKLEVLGGLANQRAGAFAADDTDDPYYSSGDAPNNSNSSDPTYSIIVVNDDDAQVSVTAFTDGRGSASCSTDNDHEHFEEITNVYNGSGWTKTLWDTHSLYPLRSVTNRCNDVFIPLFTN